jgi:hypothetical protein
MTHWFDAEASPPVPVFGGATPPPPAPPVGVLVAGAVVGAGGAVFVASGSSVGAGVFGGVGVWVFGGPSVGVSHTGPFSPNATSSAPLSPLKDCKHGSGVGSPTVAVADGTSEKLSPAAAMDAIIAAEPATMKNWRGRRMSGDSFLVNNPTRGA